MTNCCNADIIKLLFGVRYCAKCNKRWVVEYKSPMPIKSDDDFDLQESEREVASNRAEEYHTRQPVIGHENI